MKFAASPPAAHGTLCKYSRLPDHCIKLLGHVSLEERILLGPPSVALHMSMVGTASMGDPLVFFGAGTVGLLCDTVAGVLELKSNFGGYL